jgi:hypothetical protein
VWGNANWSMSSNACCLHRSGAEEGFNAESRMYLFIEVQLKMLGVQLPRALCMTNCYYCSTEHAFFFLQSLNKKKGIDHSVFAHLSECFLVGFRYSTSSKIFSSISSIPSISYRLIGLCEELRFFASDPSKFMVISCFNYIPFFPWTLTIVLALSKSRSSPLEVTNLG